MKFKIGYKKEETKLEIAKTETVSDIFIQNQVADNEMATIHPPKFNLSWCIEYKNGEKIQSDWTPSTFPSITRAMEGRNDGETLLIKGNSQIGSFEIDLVKVKMNLVKSFGYIAEQSTLTKGKEYIVGMWIDLKDNKMVKAYRNGRVKEMIR